MSRLRPLSSRLKYPFILMALLLCAVRPASADLLIVACNGEARAALVDANTYKTLASLATGAGPHEIRVSPDRRYAYVAITGTGPNGVKGNSITVVDLKSQKIKANFDLGSFRQPHDVRVSRNGRLIWVVCAPDKTILEMDSESGKILKSYKTNQDGAWFLEITPDERKIYTPNLEGKSVSVINRATGEVKIIPFEDAVYGIDITPDGRQIWVSGPGIAVIDTATDKVIARLKTTEPSAGRVRITRDGRRAVVGMDSKRLLVFDVKTRQMTREIELDRRPKVITVSGDGRRAFLSNPNDNSVTVVDLVAGKQAATFQTGKTPDGIAWVD